MYLGVWSVLQPLLGPRSLPPNGGRSREKEGLLVPWGQGDPRRQGRRG